ncbi:hypothetical protein [Janthinobacterium sp. HLS12-2]|uniref:hypothetical protein n=1 Tax=Janthinobacterium sp. HLS12-2 TaxID=1259324 RepID=UPI003F25D35A
MNFVGHTLVNTQYLFASKDESALIASMKATAVRIFPILDIHYSSCDKIAVPICPETPEIADAVGAKISSRYDEHAILRSHCKWFS